MSNPLPPIRVRRPVARRGYGRERRQRGRWSRWGRAAAALAGLACLGFTAGCGAGFDAQSLNLSPRSGTARIGNLRINNVWVIMDPVTRNAEIIGAVANSARRSNSDQLLSVTADGERATLRPAAPEAIAAALPNRGVSISGNTVTIAGNSAVSFGRPGRPELEISGVPFTLGHFTKVDFDFANAGRATVTTLVMPPTGLFADYDPNAPNPVASPTSSPAAVPTTSPAAGATTSATPSPTPSTSGYALNKVSNPLSTKPATTSTPVVASASAPAHPARVHGRA